MRVEAVRLRRFKSIYDQRVPFRDFNVLTGPNGSGKTNLLTGLGLLGELHRYGLDYAVGRAGGPDAIAWRQLRRTTSPVTLDVRVSFGLSEILIYPRSTDNMPEDASIEVRHQVCIRPSKDNEDATFEAGDEQIEVVAVTSSGKERILTAETNGFGLARTPSVTVSENLDAWERSVLGGSRVENYRNFLEFDWLSPSTSLFESLPPAPWTRLMRSAMSRMMVFRLNPEACRSAGTLTPGATLSPDGGNLPGVVARMRRGKSAARHAWLQVVEAMKEIFADLTDIRAEVNGAGRLECVFVEEGISRPWRAFEVSDGTIQYLALMCLIFDGHNTALIVEEPETGLHPWMLRSFLERARREDSRQVLLTTHSPTVLRLVEPADVLIAWKKNKVTRIAPLVEVDDHAERLYRESGIDVFEQYDSGLISEALPAGLGGQS